MNTTAVSRTKLTRVARACFFVAACLFDGVLANADEAVEASGRIHQGRLQFDKKEWIFRTANDRRLSLWDLSFVRFGRQLVPPPTVPLTHVFRLPGAQRITGTFLRVDDKKVTFATSWGATVSLARERILGIQHADDALPILHDDFETTLKPWRIDGAVALSQVRPFFGKSSLLLDAPGQRAARLWKPPLRDGTMRFFARPAGNLNWTVEIITEPAREKPLSLVVDKAGCRCVNMARPFGALKPRPDWNVVSAEVANGWLRIYLGDQCLGETPLQAKETLHGIRFTSAGAKASGKLWIDELSVTRPLPSLPWPSADKTQDTIWLEKGEQLFGRIVSADADAVHLDAKFGKRAFPWSRVRGILFAQTKKPAEPADPEITFRPGPGFPVDRVRAKLVRWDDTKLIVAHALFGEIAIERERLDRIRPQVK